MRITHAYATKQKIFLVRSRQMLPLKVSCEAKTKTVGLVIIPALLPFHVQSEVLNNTLLRDLSNPSHNTNIHFHHSIKYPECGKSFFGLEPFSSSHFEPLDPLAHKPLSVERVLNKRLRWMTLGGQYDWTAKQYPSEKPPAFPEDLQELLHRFFPHTVAEAAIVNVYSPGDILSLHRDVSEFCNRGLISISIGCDALFVIALGKEGHNQNSAEYAVIRLRSGDAVYMTGESRYAWHGVPQIIANTCPAELQAWPCISNSDSSTTMKPDSENTRFRYWHSWLARKRINLNVRQMFEG